MSLRALKALRVSAGAAADPGHWAQLLELAAGSEVNAMVLDLKEGDRVHYDTGVETAHAIGAVRAVIDPTHLLDDLTRNGLTPIARITSFLDTSFAEAFPHLALKAADTGDIWRTFNGEAWVDPTARQGWDYVAALAVEAARMGFREVQLDYVRFPTGGPRTTLPHQSPAHEPIRVDAITRFAHHIGAALHEEGCRLALDVFGIVVVTQDDQGIGQQLERLADPADVLCPMVYPGLYEAGWLELDDPTAFPGVVVGHALDAALERVTTELRPWLQAWGLPPEGIKAQIHEAEKHDLGWMLWSQSSSFDAAIFA